MLRGMNQADDLAFMQLAIEQARIGRDEGGVPIGGVLVADGKVVGAGHNRRVQHNSAIRHGETELRLSPGGFCLLPASLERVTLTAEDRAEYLHVQA